MAKRYSSAASGVPTSSFLLTAAAAAGVDDTFISACEGICDKLGNDAGVELLVVEQLGQLVVAERQGTTC